jgi:hypothetical protein
MKEFLVQSNVPVGDHRKMTKMKLHTDGVGGEEATEACR